MKKCLELIAKIQANPKNINAYRSLVEYYRSMNMLNEAAAFDNLIIKKFHDHNPDNHIQ